MLRAIDAERVGLFGYSQGGWIAPIAAARSDEVAFLVLVASIGVTPSEQMMVAVERQLRLAGYGDDVVERALDLRRRFEHWIHEVAPEPDEQLDADLLAAVDEPWAGQLWLPPTLLDEEGVQLWIEEMDYDPRPTFERVRVPTLSFYGELDSWAPVEASVAGLAGGARRRRRAGRDPGRRARPDAPGRELRARVRAHARRLANRSLAARRG